MVLILKCVFFFNISSKLFLLFIFSGAGWWVQDFRVSVPFLSRIPFIPRKFLQHSGDGTYLYGAYSC